VKTDAFLLEIQAFPQFELKTTCSILTEHQNSCILSINPKIDLNAITDDGIQEFTATLKYAFRLAVEAGPLCGEPMENVRFHIERIELFQQLQSSKYTSLL
jgi:translation elongation factor EF-G